MTHREEPPNNNAGTSSPQEARIRYRGTGFYVSLAVILLIAAFLLVFAVQNTDDVTIRLFTLEFELPLFAVFVGAALVAILLDELIGLVWRRQRRLRLEERHELQQLRSRVQTAGEEESSEPPLTTADTIDRHESSGAASESGAEESDSSR